jgi:molecular chaperone DnaK
MPAERENLVGIDLGTTVSVIAQLKPDGSTHTIDNSDGNPLTPSVVYLDGNTALVGESAKSAAAIDSSRAAMFIKRDMGGSSYCRTVGGRQFRPETLSAIILRKLKQDAEKRIGPISRAVITVPAFFDDTRRKATEDAGRIAGLEVLDIINEPTAAALAYAVKSHGEGGSSPFLDIPGGEMTAVVYDLGGGTFDVTVVRLRAKHFETIATDGEVQLGGKDWDDKIVEHLAAEFEKQFHVNPLADGQRRDALGAIAEKCKILLSKLQNAPVEVSYQGHSLTAKVSRKQFEDITVGLLTRTRLLIESVVTRQAELDWSEIDRVLLVGGSTRMPMVRAMLHEVTGQEPDGSLHADQVVAQGAAIHAGIVAAKAEEGELEIADDLKEEYRQVEELNVNSHSLGIQAVDRRTGRAVNAVLIRKNTHIPFAASKVFPLRFPGATSVRVRVLEGEAREAANNIQIGECRIQDLPGGLPKGAPIQVRLAYNASGRVSVMALDMTHGRFAQTAIEHQHGLSQAQIEQERQFVDSLEIP